MELPTDFDLVRAGPVCQVVESELANPCSGLFVEDSEGPEATLLPLPQVSGGYFKELLSSSGLSEEDVAGDFGVSEQFDVLVMVAGLPLTEDQAWRLQLNRTLSTAVVDRDLVIVG
jgi:hypothetical protein